MSGRMGDLSDKQAEKLEQFKDALKDVLQEKHGDIWLLRFLRARGFDLKKSESSFRKDLVWRKRMTIDKLKEWVPPEALTKYYGGGFIGYDKEGAPLWFDPLGKLDTKGILRSCKGSDYVKFWIQRLEKINAIVDEQNKKLGKDVGGLIALADMEGLGGSFLWKPWTDMNKKLTGLVEQHYPENLKQIIVFNTPKIFSVIHAMFAPFMHKETRKKIIVLGSNWKTDLLRYVDADTLPVCTGGTRVDPDGDPLCPRVLKRGGKIPESYYLKDEHISDRNLTTRRVPQAGKLEFKYKAEKPGSILSYEFKTKQADIGFSVKRINKDGSKVDIVVKERYNCHISPEEGQQTIDESGTYVVIFDNSYSLMRSKTLSYYLELLEPVGAEEPEFEEQKQVEDIFTFD